MMREMATVQGNKRKETLDRIILYLRSVVKLILLGQRNMRKETLDRIILYLRLVLKPLLLVQGNKRKETLDGFILYLRSVLKPHMQKNSKGMKPWRESGEY
jgi:hypothetical protein